MMARSTHQALIWAIAAALVVAGCGGNAADGGTASEGCAKAVGPFVDGLKAMNSRLDIGMTYADYGTQLGAVKAAYDDVKWSDLDDDCTKGIGVDAEDAMNHYIKAYGTWRDCIETTGCDNDSIKPDLQAEWSAASTLIDKVRGRLP